MFHRFDLSRLPPDTMMRQDAVRWVEAETLVVAIRQGVDDARMEKAALDLPDTAFGQVG